MPRMFQRAVDAKPTDWREDKKYVAAVDRLAEVERLIAAARARVRDHHAGLLRGLAAEVERAELEVLAGRGAESTLAAAQQKHLDARMAEAKDKLAIEDLDAEKAKLEAKIPELRRAAKQAALKSIRGKYRAVLLRLQAALTSAVDADAELFALSCDAEKQFVGTDHTPGTDPDGFPRRANLHTLSRTYFDISTGRHLSNQTIKGNTVAFLERIEEALKALDEEEAAEAAPAPESAGLV